jgi:hypothetical protein
MPELPANDWKEQVRRAILRADFRRATFGGVVRGGSVPWNRVVVRPVQIQGKRQTQFSYFDQRKDITKNADSEDAASRLEEILGWGFSAIHVSTGSHSLDVRITKKGKAIVGRGKPDEGGDAALSHNREKGLPLPEGRADRLLQTMGIMTAEGKIRASMRGKFTQINEFLKQLSHVFDDAGLRSMGREMLLLDCGCGSSYLTLAAHHFLNDVLLLPAKILGIDVNDEVIRKSIERSRTLNSQGIDFACGPIGSFDAKPDVVVALHACDTATDDAIAHAIRSEAKLLLSVPCCHHHFNERISAEGPSAALKPILRHGILRERMADLATDAFRAAILRIMGYRAEIVEFVSQEHTGRNLMIRAVRTGRTGDRDAVAEYCAMREFWRETPYLETLLGDQLQGRINQSL